MLIQQVARPLGALLIQSALRFGSAEPRPIGLRLFRRLFSLVAFLKSFEVDHISHAGPRQPTHREYAAMSRRRERWALADFIVIKRIPVIGILIASKNTFRSAKTKYQLL